MMERKDMGKLTELGGVEGIAQRLQCSLENGIQSGTAGKREELYGKNELWRKDPVTFLEFFVEALSDKIIIILGIAACISIIFGMTLPDPHSGNVERSKGWIEGTAILISIMVVTLVGSINNYEKAKKFEEMENEQAVFDVQVMRDGEEVTIKSNEIVVGDILMIEGPGSQLSCDGLFVFGNDLKVDESAMTGEPDVIKKTPERDPFFLSGTQLQDGIGRMLVILVGQTSYQGKMKAAVSEESGETPLQEHLAILADDVGKLGAVGAAVLIAALFIKEGVKISDGKEATATAFLNYIILAITVIVVAIPEGLPLAVTIALAFSMKAMMKDNCMVRVLASCETMGAATAVCSDKTGTLTTNEMTVVQGVVNGEEFVISGYGVNPRTAEVSVFDRSQPQLGVDTDLMIRALSHNSTARQQMIDGRLQWVGNKTEHGLLGFASVMQRDYLAVRNSVAEKEKKQFPFNSTKKRMSTIVRETSGAVLYTKGASEVILEACGRYIDRHGAVVALPGEKKEEFMEMINDMANQGNRTIGVAYEEFSGPLPDEEPESTNLILIGVFGIQDPIRTEVPAAVEKCKIAGINVRMVTGDNINTAIAIAKKCGIYSENGWDKALTGVEFRAMYNDNKAGLMELVPRLRVLARSSPQDKYILVGLLQEIGEVVGVTGDGTNDAPALKLANVGFAMHIGTDIAKGAADMVLLDNNFASVVNAVKWGRAVNDNIKKFLQYQLAINVGGVVLTVIGSLASETSKEPFTPVQLLWLNLIMDTLAALALATELPSDELLFDLPVFKQAPLITNRMKVFVGAHSAAQVAITFMHMFSSFTWLDTVEGDCSGPFTNTSAPEYLGCQLLCKDEGGVFNSDGDCQQGTIHSTIIFNTFIWMQIFNIFNARLLSDTISPLHGLTRSYMLVVVVFIICGFQVFAVEAAASFMQTTSLDWQNWLICVAFGAAEIPFGVLVRLVPAKNEIPQEVLDKWEHENRLRRALGVAPLHMVPEAQPQLSLISHDPSLKNVHVRK
ncbi:vacuolar-type Ca2+-ATPase 2, putative [Bodo saltans]|uniref:P-type Cu(+) transporter n=1 Tax=Bodo saltans TaxID=75058 RepID=A0A0S4JRV4_BODSA|nr:vacuolar-type Ca2+-ATPase 2, putative [Bodo saltans]|eukprot:CUG92690.1 vacuolar-type Ca2+-ATPase 2, putative [Bodo saltans]